MILAVTSSSAFAAPDEAVFHIPAEPIAEALVDFALQAKLSVGYSGVDFQGAMAKPVEGRLQPEQALKRLLAGSGFEALAIDSDTIRISRLATNSPPPAQGPPVEEIVVTTTKRAEIAQSLPYSIAAVTDGDIDDFGLRTVNDLTGHVAALSATDLGPGRNKLAIRGLSDSSISGRSQSVVGLYLDESRLTDDDPDPSLRLVDINRIEVVRGPQGTLYGSGALSGLVRIITNKPVLDREQAMAKVSTETTENGGVSAGLDAVLNLPLVPDILALRAVGYVRRAGGYIDETRLAMSDANQVDTTGTRLTLLWQAANDWSITAGLTDQLIQAADSQYFQGGLGFLSRRNSVPEPRRDQFLQASLTIEGTLDWAQLTSTTAFTKRAIAEQYDATLGWPSLTGFPAGPAMLGVSRRIDTVTEETRLTSVGESRLSWVVGAFASHRDESYHAFLEGPDPADMPYTLRARQRDDYANEAALFGEGTYHLTDTISVTAGLRMFYASLSAAAHVDVPPSGESAAAQGGNDSTGFIPKLVIGYRPSSRLTLYADAAEGFRLGGVNINNPMGAINANARGGGVNLDAATFASDSLWSYEVGAKALFLDGRLVANAAAYMTVWDNIQSDQILPNGGLYTANAGTTHTPGFEVDLNLQVTRNLRLQGNFFWHDADIIHPNPILIQFAGQLPSSPESNFGFSGRYEFFHRDDWDAFATLQYTYVGRETIGFDERYSPKMGDYSIVNARLGVVQGAWRATVYVNNVTDERANMFAYGNPFSFGLISQVTPPRPRTVGVDLSWSY